MSLTLPTVAGSWDNITTIHTHSLDGADDEVAGLVRLPAAATIDAVSFLRTSNVGTPPDYEVAIQAPGTSGLPDGTDLATGTYSPPSGFSGSATRVTVSLSSSYAASAGLYWVIVRPGGTAPTTSNRIVCSYGIAGMRWLKGVRKTSASWSAAEYVEAMPPMAMHAGSTRYGQPVEGYEASGRVTAASGYRIAYRFEPAFDMSCIGAGMACYATDGFAAKVGLWDDSGTQLGADDVHLTAAPTMHAASWPAVSLTAGTVYHFGVESNDTGTLRVSLLDVTGTVDGSSPFFPLSGYASAWNTSSWSGAGSEQPIGFLEIEDPSGGGSSGYSRSRVVNG